MNSMRKIIFCIIGFLAGICQLASGYSLLAISNPWGEATCPVTGQSSGMGGVGVALEERWNLSMINPANLCGIDAISFSFSSGSQLLQISDDAGESAVRGSSSIPFVVFAFPFPKLGVLSAAYREVSRIEYDYSPNATAAGPEYRNSFNGSGLRYAARFGFSREVTRWLHAGVAYERLIGYEKHSVYIDYTNTDFADRSDTVAVNTQGNYAAIGVSLFPKKFSFGLSLLYPVSTSEVTWEHRRSIIYPGPTVAALSPTESSGTEDLPFSLVAGMATTAIRRFTLGLDMSLTDWNNYSREGFSGVTSSTVRVALGSEWVYDRNSEFSWIERVPLRCGLFYDTWPSNEIKEAGLSLGSGMPLGKETGMFDVFFTYSRRGSLERQKLVENNFKFGFTITGCSNPLPESRK
jgi:hypothetical protein